MRGIKSQQQVKEKGNQWVLEENAKEFSLSYK